MKIAETEECSPSAREDFAHGVTAQFFLEMIDLSKDEKMNEQAKNLTFRIAQKKGARMTNAK